MRSAGYTAALPTSVSVPTAAARVWDALRLREWRALDSRIWRLAIARTVNTMGLSLVMSFLGAYLVLSRGYPAWTYGAVACVANFVQAWTHALAGDLSDRIGRRPVILWSLWVRSVLVAGLGTLVLMNAPFWLIGVAVICTSALRGGFEPVASAMVTDLAQGSARLPAFALQRVGINLGWAIGPALGGILTHHLPYGAVFYIASAGMILAAMLLHALREATRTVAVRGTERVLTMVRAALSSRVERPLVLATFLASLVQTQMFSTFAIFLSSRAGLTLEKVGLLYAVNGVCVVLLQMPAVSIVRRLHSRFVMAFAALVYAVGFVLVGRIDSMATGVVAIIVISSAEVLFAPAHQAAISMLAPAAMRGRSMGVYGFVQMVGVALAPLLGGLLLDLWPQAHVGVWLVFSLIAVLEAMLLLAFARRAPAESAE